MQAEPGLHPLQHGLGRSDLGLSDRPRRLDIDDHAMIRVGPVVVGIAEKCWPLAGRGPLARRLGMRGELGLDLAGRPECGLVQRKLVEQRRLHVLSWPHHRSILPPARRIESATYTSTKPKFFNKIRPGPRARPSDSGAKPMSPPGLEAISACAGK